MNGVHSSHKLKLCHSFPNISLILRWIFLMLLWWKKVC